MLGERMVARDFEKDERVSTINSLEDLRASQNTQAVRHRSAIERCNCGCHVCILVSKRTSQFYLESFKLRPTCNFTVKKGEETLRLSQFLSMKHSFGGKLRIFLFENFGFFRSNCTLILSKIHGGLGNLSFTIATESPSM